MLIILIDIPFTCGWPPFKKMLHYSSAECRPNLHERRTLELSEARTCARVLLYGLSPLPMTAVQDRFLLPLPRMVFIPQSQREEPNSKYPAECAETVGCRSMLKQRRRHSLLSTDDLCHMVRIGKMTVIAPRPELR